MEIVLKMHGLENHPVYRTNLRGKYDHLRWHEVLSVINQLEAENFADTDEVYLILKSAHLEHSSYANLVAKGLIDRMNSLNLPQVLISSVMQAIETGAVSILHVVELSFCFGQMMPIQYHEVLEKHKPSMEEFYKASNLLCFSGSHRRFIKAIFRINVLRTAGSELSYGNRLHDHIKTTFVDEVIAMSSTEAGPALSVVETVSVSAKGAVSNMLQISMIKLRISLGDVDRTVLVVNSDASCRLALESDPKAGDPPSFWDESTRKFIKDMACIDRSSTSSAWLLYLRLLLCKVPERFNHSYRRELVAFDGRVF